MGLAMPVLSVATERYNISTVQPTQATIASNTIEDMIVPALGAVVEIQWPDSADKYRRALGIPVSIEQEGEGFVVMDYVIDMYGVGSTVEAAIEDYESFVIEYFRDLIANEDKLSDHLKTHLCYLRTKATFLELKPWL